jgi:hypothetical protein
MGCRQHTDHLTQSVPWLCLLWFVYVWFERTGGKYVFPKSDIDYLPYTPAVSCYVSLFLSKPIPLAFPFNFFYLRCFEIFLLIPFSRNIIICL